MSQSFASGAGDAEGLLRILAERGIELYVESGRLRFRAPQGALTPALREDLTARKDALIRLLSGGRAATAAVEAPCSSAQRRHWFLERMAPGSPAYHVHRAVRMRGRLDVSALERALDELGRRHETLRTSFREVEGQPLQVIAPFSPVPLPRVSLAKVPPAERDAWVLARSRAQAQAPFDLSRGPLLRAELLEVDAETHVLLFTTHHIVVDAWSMEMLAVELGRHYAAALQGLPPLAELDAQYRDFVQAEREYLTTDTARADLAYWRARLGGDPPALLVPTDHARPARRGDRGFVVRRRLSPELTRALRELARTRGVTPYVALLAAFEALLHRYCRQDQILIGTAVSVRPAQAYEPLIGCFANTLLLATDLAGEPTFVELLERVRDTVLGAMEHQALPFDRVAELFPPSRRAGTMAGLDVVFAYQNADRQIVALPGLALDVLPTELDSSRFELSLTVLEWRDELELVAEAASELFEPPTVARLLGHLEALVRGATRDPSTRISALPMLSPEERAAALAQGARAQVPAPLLIHQRFEEHAARRPDAIAVRSGEEQLSYRELDRRANQLAHRLRRLGIGPDQLVGLCLERGLSMVVGLLGVLKAGGAYLPLDPDTPPERIGFMLTDARAEVLVTEERLRDRLPEHPGKVVCLDSEAAALAEEPDHAPASGVGSQHLAYVIYTSGSTGKPKGVLIEHAQVARLFAATESWYHFDERDVWTLFHSYAFDFSVWELWGALAYGGRLVVVPYLVSRAPEAFLRLLAAERVTVLNQTPSAFRQLMAVDDGAPLALRFVIFGGEALELESLRPWFERRGDVTPQLVNMYGITETTVHVTYRPIGAVDLATRPGSVIGRPIPDLSVYVLDARLEPVPLGVPGELFVGGAGLARGYLGRPELTAERFLQSPFVPGERLYRTGDLARRLASGDLEYLGRIDHQVKIRGFRIELGEIESTLARDPRVRETTVLVREDTPGDRRLVAYLVARGDAPSAEELRAALATQLPDYMLPSAFVFLDQMPLNANGKLDRAALPRPEAGAHRGEGTPPRTPIEQVLAQLWCGVLSVPAVTLEDDFFAAGGHSLLATQLIAAVRSSCGVELPLRTLFDSPTLGALAAAVETARRAPAVRSAPPIEPVAPDAAPALSFSQERLWFLDRFLPGSAFYNMSAAFRLRGALERAALERSLTAVVARHQVLRTTFPAPSGRPEAVVAPPAAFPLPLVDLGAIAGAARTEALARHVRAEAERPFDLEHGPLFRAGLVRLGPEEHVLHVAMHHIVADGWSVGVLIRELAALYAGATALPPLPFQFTDYAAWQRRFLSGEVLDALVGYWKKKLAGAPPVLALPTDRPRPTQLRFLGARHAVRFPRELALGLAALARREGATLYMVLLAGLEALLARYSGQNDFIVGSPIANRGQPGLEGLIGPFFNTLLLRADLAGDPTVRELVARVRETTLDAYAHQDAPFEKLVQELNPERSLSYTPLFQVVLALENYARRPAALESLEVSLEEIDLDVARCDLMFFLEEQEGALSGSLVYSKELFDAPSIERLVRHFQTLLEEMVRAPDERLSSVALVGPSERAELAAFNHTDTVYPAAGFVPEQIEAQVDRAPERVAVRFEETTLSYAELDRRANRLAHRLRRLGVGPDDVVGVAMERSLELVVALLGVLKSGGAYLPLDPEQPPDRLAFMAGQAQIRVLLTQESLLARLPPDGAERLCLDREPLLDEPAGRPRVSLDGDHLAYVIYTSGSTGKPKGVMNTHRGLANRLAWMQATYRLDPSCRVLQKTPYGFDVSVWEFFWPLLVGAELVVAKPREHQDAAQLVRTVRAAGVTTMHFVPSMLAAFLEQPGVESATGLRQVFASGEALPAALERRFFARLPHAELHNLYGPTEASIDVTAWRCDPEQARAQIPIGRPIANTQIHILGPCLDPQPIGVPGELYIGGIQVARGYLARPDLTAERFVPDPFAAAPGMRLYRTGDRARVLADGTIEYLGRLDHQIKLRGFRIELGEIEEVLRRDPRVREAAVIVRDEGGPHLVAYLVPSGAAPAPAELREALRQKLPEHMIPSRFVTLPLLPLSPNGKLDRRALPAPGGEGTASAAFVAPSTAAERLLAETFRELLLVERVGCDDNFFELGGHSLLATQLLARVHDLFQVELPLRAVFTSPTPAGLRRELSARLGGAELLETRATGTTLTKEIIPRVGGTRSAASFSQERLWFLAELEGAGSSYNIFAALELTGPLDAAALERSLNEIVRRHQALRTRFEMGEDRLLQVVAPLSPLSLAVTDLSALEAEPRWAEVRRRAQAEARAPFELASGLLLRAAVLRLDEEQHVLLFTMHHIASDGWSLGVLVAELAALYPAFRDGLPSPLPEPPIQFPDYAAWQRARFDDARKADLVAFWKEELDGAQALRLPTDHARPPVQTHRGGQLAVSFEGELRERLDALARAENATLYMVLLAAFQTVLHRYSGQDDIVVGSPVANRGRVELEKLIGFFVNTLVLRTDFGGEPTFRDVLRQVRERTLAAFAHQDMPFEKLVEELKPERSLAQQPLFQVMFVLQNAPLETLRLPGLELHFLEVESGSSKFDLNLSLQERGGAVRGFFEYASDLFEPKTVERLWASLVRVLEAVALEPDQRVSRLPLLDAAERRRLLVEWNDTPAPEPRHAAVHTLFEEQVDRTPDALAASFGDASLSYRELDRRANQLARRLVALGVGPDVLVGISVERSLDLVLAVMAVYKAGGAYLPIDPAYPADRLKFMLEDTRAPVVLTQGPLRARLPLGDARVVCLDEEGSATLSESDERLPARASGENLGYVIYTSGSTGRPKGIALPHRALTNLIEWHRRELLGGARTLQFASLNFDASFHELFAALTTGGSIHLIAENLRRDPLALARFLTDQRIEKVILPVVVLQQMAEEYADRPGFLESLRELTTTGEQLQITQPVVRLFDRLRGCVFHNHYGPSETHVVTALTLSASPAEWPLHPSIGRPIARTQIYVLDRHLLPVPVGVVGDLYIGGVMLARGYFGRPDLTAEKFVPDPFGAPGERLYRTGDLARWLSDGNIEFLGRSDHQLKIRGFRVEPGEIEAALGQHAGLVEAAVVARDGATGKRLVAYVVPSKTVVPSTNELRAFLATKLPDYMIPSAFVHLAALPLNPNGKVDRKALPEPAGARPDLDHAYVAPRNVLEETLAAIWADLLGVDRVGIDDGFFELGGHSLLAVRLMARVREACGVDVPLRALFEAPTIEGMIQAIERARVESEAEVTARLASLTARVTGLDETQVERELDGEVASDATVRPPSALPDAWSPARKRLLERWWAAETLDRERSLPLPRVAGRDRSATSHQQFDLWERYRMNPGGSFFQIGGALELRGPLDVGALARALDAIRERHEVLRARYAEVGGTLRQTIHPFGPRELPVVDLAGVPEAERLPEALSRARKDFTLPFDLERGDVVRQRLYRIGDQHHLLVLVVHHVAFDGFSMGVFCRELGTFYGDAAAGRAFSLHPLAFEYGDYAAWQRGFHRRSVAAEQERWWRHFLDGSRPLVVPTDLPRPSVASGDAGQPGAFHVWMAPPDLVARLKDVSRRESVTWLGITLATAAAVMRAWTQEEDLVFINSYVNRDRPGLEQLLGYVSNPMVTRVKVHATPTFRELRRRVREAILGIRAHSDLSLTRVGLLDPAHAVNFNFLPPLAVPALPGLEVRFHPLHGGLTVFDLALFVQPTADSLAIRAVYPVALYRPETIAGWMERYGEVLRVGLEHPDAPARCRW